ncbi:hypothetical protein MLD52_08280 [Puniceicoccaceae bacterium K14]|nr:hypothetical protein [Puniceicoccaceae bacterium K14]
MGQRYSKLEWAKSFRKIPTPLKSKLAEMGDEHFVVACSKELVAGDFENERYAHLDILEESDLWEGWTSLIPTPNVGRTSYLNCEVSEEIDKSAGKVSKRFVSQAPDWKGSGMHEIRYSKEVWAKRLVPPSFTQLGFRRLDSPEEGNRLLVHFEVHELFHLKMEGFEEKLLRALNLLQENVGKVGLSAVNETDRKRIGELSRFIGWFELKDFEVRDIPNLLSARESSRKAQVDKLTKLLDFEPRRILRGANGFSSYLCVQYTDDLFVCGNFSNGSLLYAVKSDWKTLFQWSQDDLRDAFTGAVERILYKPGWYERLRALVFKERRVPLDDQTLLDL